MPQSIRLAMVGDVHWGAVPATELLREMDACLFRWLGANQFDAIILLGDWFDRRLSLDSEDSKLAMEAMVRLCRIAQARDVPIRIIKGTLSHDYWQLDNYRPLEAEFPQLRIHTTAAHEELLPGFDVLWMPEEYPVNYDDFYGNVMLDKETGNGLVFDAIFGHGEIDVAAGWAAGIEGERRYGGTPCHSAEVLLDFCSGPVWFAHIHKRFRYRGRLGYPGSLTRWCQGEEEGKGFDVLTLTAKEEGGWSVQAEVIPNELAPIYRTVRADEIMDEIDPPDEMVRKIREAADGAHRLRVKFGSFAIGIEQLSVVRGALVDDHRVDLQAAARVSGATEDEQALEEGAPAAPREDRLAYLRDSAVPGPERLLRFIRETNPEANVTLDQVVELTAPLS